MIIAGQVFLPGYFSCEVDYRSQKSAATRPLSGCRQWRLISQQLHITQRGGIPGIALKYFLKLFERLLKFFLFV